MRSNQLWHKTSGCELSVFSCQLSVEWRMQDFRKLTVWQKAHHLTLAVYRETGRFPAAERFGLTSQMRRAAASIGSNIAEGCCRDPGPDFARFLQTAMGSASELEYQFILGHGLRFLSAEVFAELSSEVAEVKRMLAALIPRVRKLVAVRN